ncbi:MAG TPA: enoyl-CoA hydratase-related protein [bacterium]|nr:enoyl-CoA hydratase-related protein [bacterium]
MKTVDYSVEGPVALVVLNRPEKKNAINHQMREDVHAALIDIRDNEDVWVAVLTGAGSTFSTGHDLSETLAGTPTVDQLYELQHSIFKPLIAAINGACLAQGCGLALGCDILVAGEQAFFGWPQVKRGICSVSGPTLLARKIPLNIAMEYLLTGEFLGAQEALALHLVNHVVPSGDVRARAFEMAHKIAANAPLAVRAMKEATLRTLPMRPDDAYRYATQLLRELERTEDAQEGSRAFLEKRAPVWRGR